MMYGDKKNYLALLALIFFPVYGHDVLLEFKGAYFAPTNDTFKNIYHGGAIYGPELTAQLYKKLYGFASVDFLSTHGKSIGLCNPTTVKLLTIGLGLKYFVPCKYGDLYVGLGVLPTRLHTHDCSPFIIPDLTKWACGGIVKGGGYFKLRHSLFLDAFLAYSFAHVKPPCPSECDAKHVVQLHNAHPNGFSIGAGIGYRFH